MVSSLDSNLPLVSVIIPNFNYEEYVADAIESVLNQTYENIELIVVDDGSTDNSWKVINRYRDRLKLIKSKNGGVSSARNIGLTAIQGDYVAFLDSDDYWYPNKISSQVSVIIENKADIAFSAVEVCDENLVPEAIMFSDVGFNYFTSYLKRPTSAAIPLACSNALVRTDKVRDSFWFDTNLHTSADIDFFRRLVQRSVVVKSDQVLVKYRRHPNSMSRTTISEYYKDNLVAVKRMVREAKKYSLRQKIYVFLGCLNFAFGYTISHMRNLSLLIKWP